MIKWTNRNGGTFPGIRFKCQQKPTKKTTKNATLQGQLPTLPTLIPTWWTPMEVIVTIVSKLVYNLYRWRIQPTYIGVIIHLLSTMDIPVNPKLSLFLTLRIIGPSKAWRHFEDLNTPASYRLIHSLGRVCLNLYDAGVGIGPQNDARLRVQWYQWSKSGSQKP